MNQQRFSACVLQVLVAFKMRWPGSLQTQSLHRGTTSSCGGASSAFWCCRLCCQCRFLSACNRAAAGTWNSLITAPRPAKRYRCSCVVRYRHFEYVSKLSQKIRRNRTCVCTAVIWTTVPTCPKKTQKHMHMPVWCVRWCHIAAFAKCVREWRCLCQC